MKNLLALLCLTLAGLTANAKGKDSADIQMAEQIKQIQKIESKITYKTGSINLSNGLATINVPAGYKFLNAADAKYIIEDVWGNLKGQSPLGLILPANQMASIADYAFIVEYDDIGFVKDEDADEIDYTELLTNMKAETIESNKQRQAQGITPMTLMGWAEKPYYDKDKKVLYWAKDYLVEGETEHTLNYDIRILGRKGVLTLQAVGSMQSIDSVNKAKTDILNMVAFNTGNKYTDFNSSTDNVAAWTIGGLVAGKVLAKVGFFAVILKFLKFILLGLAVAGGAIWRFVTGRKKKQEDELVYETVDNNKEIS